MKRYIIGILLMLSLTFFTGEGFSMPPEDFERPPSKEQMEKIRKRVGTLKIWRLTKILDLDEETASKLFPLINKNDKKRLDVEKNMRKDMRKLRRSVDTASEKELRAIIKRLENDHRRLQNINREEMEELKNMLTVREIAKLLLFKQDFDREMKRIITEVRGKRARRLRDKAMEPSDE